MKISFLITRTLLLTLLVFAGIMVPRNAAAVPRYVTINADNGTGSLRDAVGLYNVGDTIVFVNMTGTITLNTPILIQKAITINGPGRDVLAIDGNARTSLFVIAGSGSNITVSLSGLTLSSGYSRGSGGGFYIDKGDVTLTNCSIHNCHAYQISSPVGQVNYGGAAYIMSGAFTATNCLFTGNVAVAVDSFSPAYDGRGGAIYNNDTGTVTLTNCSFTDNQANAGAVKSGSNSAGTGSGGALYNAGSAYIYNCTFQSNTARGGYSMYSDASGNGAGGAIFNSKTCRVSGSAFIQNLAEGGYANYATDGYGDGGAILNINDMGIYNCTLTGNIARGGGSLGVQNPTGTGGNGYGGGIGVGGVQYFEVSNCTLRGNLAVGGINHFSAKGFGGNAYINGPINLLSTILSGGVADIYPDIECVASGQLSSHGHNLVKDPTGASGLAASDIINVDPRLGLLQNNGGPTQTMALLPGSPAIDAGSNITFLSTDGRGFSRTSDLPGVPNLPGGDGTDIGAYEFRPSDHSDFNGDSFADLVLQNSTAQQVAFWFTNGPSITGGVYALSGANPIPLPPNWQVAATGDFNGDGTPDLVLDNTSTGQIAFWFTSGNSIIAGAYATSGGGSIGVPAGWQIVGAADFNADGKPDLVLQNPSSQTAAIWTMNGTSLISGAYLSASGSPINLPPGWQIVGTADFNGDGQPDLVLDNPSNGQIAMWMMSGFSVLSGSYLTYGGAPFLLPAGWQIAGVGDYNGDGQPDLVLQNLSSRLLAFWYVGGTSFIGSSYALSGGSPIALPTGWQVAGPR